METGSYFKQVHLVGGDLALDFVNTQTGPPDGPADGDALGGYDDLLSWSRHMGTMGERQAEALALISRARPAAASEAFRKAVGTRSYLWEIFATLARQQEPPVSLLDLLRDDAASSVRYARLARTAGGFGWDWATCDDLRAPLWPVVQAAADLLRSGPVTSVKRCGACRFLFVDTSKNGSRRWCSMEDCGKTAKMRRYVARRSLSRASARADQP
jgi:predicted RNA-binding Zn ribbon-like protein